jgi:hypothetical protein
MTERRSKKNELLDALNLMKLLEEYDSLLAASDELGLQLSIEGEILKDVMDQHPEYKGFKHGEEIELSDRTTMSPRLHIAIDAAIETQIATNNPAEAREAYLALLKVGVEPHEARHAVGRVLLDLIWQLQLNRLATEPNTYYIRQLKELKRKKLKHKVFTAYK